MDTRSSKIQETNKRRVAIFSLVYLPHFVGGAEIALKEITDRMPSDQFDLHLITLRAPGDLAEEEKLGNITVHRILGHLPLALAKLLYPFAAYRTARSLHRERPFVHIWSIMAAYGGFAALFFKYRFSNIRFLLTLQEGDPIPYIKRRARFVYPLFKRIFTRADAVQAISSYLADWAKEMGARSVEVVPNGVDVEGFKTKVAEESIRILRNELLIREDEKVLITTSRLVEKNAVGDVIESLQYLPNNIKFLILGVGPLEDRLRAQVGELKLANRVLFLGHVPYEKLPLYLQASDVFIRPSISEGMGNSFIEAMAAGIPVIATPVGGIPDFLKDKETGLFCAVHDPKDIARKVTILLRDRDILSYVVGNAQRLVSGRHEWSHIARKMQGILSV